MHVLNGIPISIKHTSETVFSLSADRLPAIPTVPVTARGCLGHINVIHQDIAAAQIIAHCIQIINGVDWRIALRNGVGDRSSGRFGVLHDLIDRNGKYASCCKCNCKRCGDHRILFHNNTSIFDLYFSSCY